MITGFLNSAIEDQLTSPELTGSIWRIREYPDGRYATTWDEVQELDAKHVIASHARSHTELSSLDAAIAEREVAGSQEDLKKE